MLLSLFLTCFVALVVSTGLLLTLGHRVRFTMAPAGVGLAVAIAIGSGLVARAIWDFPSKYAVYGQVLLVACGVGIVLARRVWNPIGQAFFATFLAAALSYLLFSVETTFGGGLSIPARLASGLLLLFEIAALMLSGSFAFESCDAVCRVRASRKLPKRDPDYLPMVSVHLAAYNEPPDMLIETIQSLEALDYPDFEIVIIDNNTKDEEVWRPVEEYCRDRSNVKFVHVDPWPGFKSGALNLALAEHTDPRAEVIGIVDADYQIDSGWLRGLVGYFANPKVAFVQSPQDYREYQGDEYLQACYDAYKYFFVTTMPSRNQRNSIIFAGTMGLLRASVIREVGGWDEWCITEDAELSLRVLRAGYQGVYEIKSFGRGVMPLTFAALKSQRFRWCFGGMQILRMHWRDLVPWRRRSSSNQLTVPQRIDYLLGSIQWMNDLVYFGFTLVLLASAIVLLNEGPLGLRPLYGAAVLLPVALILSGLLRALWALRVTTGINWKRAIFAFANWLSLSWTVAYACIQGLTRKEGVFLRTPKTDERNRLWAALWSARTETLWVLALWALAIFVAVRGRATPFVLTLFFWQGVVYASAPFMSWLNQHTELSGELERRRRTEWLRERASIGRLSLGALGGVALAAAILFIVGLGGTNPGNPGNPFRTPSAEATETTPTEPAPSTTPTTGSSDSSSTTTSPPDTSPPTTGETTPTTVTPAT